MVTTARERVLVDSSVFLELLLEGERSGQAKKLLSGIKEGKRHGVVSAFSIAEVKYHVLRKLGHAEAAEAAYLVEAFPNVEVVDVTAAIAADAADLRYKYYDRKNRPVSFGDAVQIATALYAGCTAIISGDADFKGLEEIRAEIY
ncbi:PIN domain-containing protein [Candidatus Micrarchaeota archaeon]|nr:PIN domain-containing protein [Candidatus Micrarchaeota archaeon]